MQQTRLLLGTVMVMVIPAAALAQSTAFTYQGELRSNGALVGGPHDLRLRLFTAATGGTQVGPQICVDNVPVTDGKFTATIDFGLRFATTATRFLEIELRPDAGQNCGDATGFTLLTPRQAITPEPRAAAASVANALAARDGSPANAVVVDNSGNVGIGTTAPTHSVHVAANGPALALQDTNPAAQQAGYVSYRDDANVERAWVGYGTAGSPHFSIINARPGGDLEVATLSLAGKIRFATNSAALTVAPRGADAAGVGIGTDSPFSALVVMGDIRFGSSGQYLITGGRSNMRIIRGTVDDLNSGHCGAPSVPIHVGTGFSVSGSTVHSGEYIITFDTPFTAFEPSVAGSSYWDSFFGGKYVTIYGVTRSDFKLRVFDSAGDNICRQFSFIAIGE